MVVHLEADGLEARSGTIRRKAEAAHGLFLDSRPFTKWACLGPKVKWITFQGFVRLSLYIEW